MLPAAAYLDELAPSGRPAMRSALHKIAAILDPRWDQARDLDTFAWAALRRDDTQKVRRALQDRYGARSANRMLSALRQVLRRCWQDGLLEHNEYLLATDIKPIAITTASPGRALAVPVIEELIRAAGTVGGLRGARDAALVTTLYAAGLRRIEAARAAIEDYDRHKTQLRVVGKGLRERVIPISAAWAPTITAWCAQRASGPLFPRITNDQLGAPMQADDIGAALHELRERSGIKFTPHDFRRSFATHLFDQGVDIALIKELMGHASIQTTTIYDKRGDEAKRRAVALLVRGAP